MPIEREKARILARDFLSMRGAPNTSEPNGKNTMRLIVDALETRSRSESHANRVHASLMQNCQFFPTVADIVNACEYTPDDGQYASMRAECKLCEGTGWRTAGGEFGTTAAYPCQHRSDQQRQGVRISREMAKHYAMEAEASEVRKRAFLAHTEKRRESADKLIGRLMPKREYGLTQADVDREIEKRRERLEVVSSSN